jgi:hypothetical protein
MDLEKPFMEFNNNHEIVNADLVALEPNGLAAVWANNRVFEDQFLKWSSSTIMNFTYCFKKS